MNENPTNGRLGDGYRAGRLRSANPTVLIVGDDPSVTESAASTLATAYGMHTRVVPDLEACVEEINAADSEDRTIDCIVCEYRLTGTNGLEVLDTVSRDHPALPFVLLADTDAEITAREAFDRGVDEYVRLDGTDDQFELVARRVETAVQLRRKTIELQGFREAVEQAGHAILITDTDGTIEYANPSVETVTGYDREEVLGNTPAMFKSGEHDKAFYSDLWGTILNGRTWRGEITNQYKSGKRYYIDQTIAPIRGESGEKPDRFVAINQDITERKRRERELTRFRSAVEHAGHGVIVTDRDGTIEYVNEAFEEMSGYSAAEAIGETPAMLKSGEHDRAFYQDLWGTIKYGNVWRGEIVNRRKDGSTYHIDQTIAPILAADDAPEGFVAINQDITELKRYERELEAQNDRLKDYSNMVAHDLRNPLNLMQAQTHALTTVLEADSDTPIGELQADIAEPTEKLETLIDRMLRLIEELLTLARHGQLVLHPEEVLLETVAEEAWRQVETPNAELFVVSETTVTADPDRLRELLSNLFRNSIEHGGDDVTVHVGPLTFRDGFYVSDDGPGIPESERDRIFNRAYTTAEEGTGFGLAIVERIAQAHTWTMEVTDSRAGGARFEFGDGR
ncbi:MAG: PAS domain S-box protein [Halobacteriota archaeon]